MHVFIKENSIISRTIFIVPVKKLYRKFSPVACLSTEAPLSTVVHAHTGFVPSFKTMIRWFTCTPAVLNCDTKCLCLSLFVLVKQGQVWPNTRSHYRSRQTRCIQVSCSFIFFILFKYHLARWDNLIWLKVFITLPTTAACIHWYIVYEHWQM